MKVYAVVNNALHHDSSYWWIVGIFDNEKDAKICMETEYEDVMKGIDRGDFPKSFNGLASDPEMYINEMMWDKYIVSDSGCYECWRIEEYDMRHDTGI